MNVAAVVAAIAVGATFLVAGGTKLARPEAWRAEGAGLGVPRPLLVVVPWVEIVLGALLVAQVALPVTAVLAGALLVAFTVLLLVHLARGEHPPCACFGAWSSRPLGWRHVVRNVVLLALCAVAALA